MALLDKLKRKEKKEPLKEKEEKEEAAGRKEEKKEKQSPRKAGRILVNVLKAPQVTEKATGMSEKNCYTFKVFPYANKIQIKKAVESAYHVDVLKVRVINIPAKTKRLGRMRGKKGGYKKAMVTVKQGQKITIVSA